MLASGSKFPSFSLTDADGSVHGADDFHGRPLVVYFYPKDDTPGCTIEACEIRDLHEDIRAAGAAVLGISADSVESHRKFRDKFGLPFLLLSDPDRKLIDACGVWGEKNVYGKIVEGILRSTFVVDADGVVRKVFPKVTPEGHGAEILAALAALADNAGPAGPALEK